MRTETFFARRASKVTVVSSSRVTSGRAWKDTEETRPVSSARSRVATNAASEYAPAGTRTVRPEPSKAYRRTVSRSSETTSTSDGKEAGVPNRFSARRVRVTVFGSSHSETGAVTRPQSVPLPVAVIRPVNRPYAASDGVERGSGSAVTGTVAVAWAGTVTVWTPRSAVPFGARPPSSPRRSRPSR
ncbi:hypothetical protein QWJ26_25365 [Streptomyces sp. CSDS2]|uniref:hypothetical protein n=1 Tax=Streptomyces sp. CSDS2 TaxID=3055051 RepID=UPI0025B178FB|nr:hypothetical protein [Streptomyces sp. CSDS2]MDN3263080.1 hypothetical protein [Streptomyces sp. CSDS2]